MCVPYREIICCLQMTAIYTSVGGFPSTNGTLHSNEYSTSFAGSATTNYLNNTAAHPVSLNTSVAAPTWNGTDSSSPQQEHLINQTTNWTISPTAMPTSSLSYKLAMKSASAAKPPIQLAPPAVTADPWNQLMQTPLQPTVVSHSAQPVFPDSLM